MAQRFDPESVDLASLTSSLRDACGPVVPGEIVGRTRLRDEVVRTLGCSQLDGENLVDTMIGRGLIRRRSIPEGEVAWVFPDVR